MLRQVVTGIGILVLGSSTLLADFSYQEKSTLTGGAMMSMLKVAGVFSKGARDARGPMVSTVAIKGNRMLHRSDLHTSIIDLDAQTITSIDMQKKTYTVMTFEQMKQMMEQMAQKMHQQDPNNPQMQVKVSADATGKTRQINGADTKEMVVKIEMVMTDQKSGQQGSMPITVDAWIGPAVKGYDEVRAFYKRMAEKIGWTPGSNAFMGRPDIAKGMSEAYKEVSKLDGVPLFETMTIGGAGQQGTPGAAPPPPSADSQDQSQPQQKPSLGGLLGRGIGVNRNKSSSSEPQQSSSNSNSGALMEMTVEIGGFSTAPVDEGQFAVPDGFKQVQPDARKM
ncbi:MAG TPA: hypothetical protein VKB88_24180 [Bryobacteraceae bacterium]|nr:hypothetical protein [Bryobacteraceae bacterium]